MATNIQSKTVMEEDRERWKEELVNWQAVNTTSTATNHPQTLNTMLMNGAIIPSSSIPLQLTTAVQTLI